MPEPRAAQHRFVRLLTGVAIIALMAATLTACGDRQAATRPVGGSPEVGVVTVAPTTVQITTDLPGRLEPIRVAEVRARVNGILLKRLFIEGSDVKQGQALYEIDPAPYQAALQSANAQTAQAEAQLANASATAQRYQPLVAANAVSRQEYDAAVAAAKSAQAQVAAGKAAVRMANINLGYTRVTAPISGHIGRSLVTEGALVSQSAATQLTTIQQVDTLYLNITQPAMAVLQLRQALRGGSVAPVGKSEAARVQVVLDNGAVYPHAGKLLFADITVDPGTGQVALRATVPNPEGMLLPGMYVRARLDQALYEHAVLLPQQAVTRGGPQGDTVIVVAADGSFAPRVIKVGPAQGSQWVILGGLDAGDQVLVDGVSRLMPGVTKVKPVAFRPETASPAAPEPAPTRGAVPAPKSGSSVRPAAAPAGQSS